MYGRQDVKSLQVVYYRWNGIVKARFILRGSIALISKHPTMILPRYFASGYACVTERKLCLHDVPYTIMKPAVSGRYRAADFFMVAGNRAGSYLLEEVIVGMHNTVCGSITVQLRIQSQ